MRQALLSDIHGNLEALQAVLADVAKQNVDEIICLGDVVGYGPNPIECLELVMKKSKLTILGNHDQAAVVDPNGFNPIAFQAIQWTRKELNRGTSRAVNNRWDYINELPKSYQADKFLFVHGSPCDPTNEYVFHETVYDRHKRIPLRPNERIRVSRNGLRPPQNGPIVRKGPPVLFPRPHTHPGCIHP